MQSENFDKKIKDSLSQRPPGNDNPEWDKMEVLLDKHLPVEKKDNRRFFFILLFLFLLIGGGALIVWQKNDGSKITDIRSQGSQTTTPSITNSNTTDKTADANKNASPEKEANDGNAKNNSDLNDLTTQKDPVSVSENQNAPEFIVTDAAVTKKIKEKKTGKPDNVNLSTKNEEPIIENTPADKKQIEAKEEIKAEPAPISTEKTEVIKEAEPKQSLAENKIDEQKKETKEEQPIASKKSNSQKQKNKSSFMDKIFFSVSAGPDYSSVDFNGKGKTELAYGAGIGYRISDKFSVRTGFYSARKVYTSDPEDYYLPSNIAQYYPNLKSIDANCKVYEIPVMIDYTISSNKKQSWFVSAGASTLLMKEEKYDYYYKPNYSPTYVKYTRTIKNENKHYFSQLNIAGGYTRNLNKNISLRAEPYMKIALNGIGFGKVDLNSGGVLFSAIIKPFAKK